LVLVQGGKIEDLGDAVKGLAGLAEEVGAREVSGGEVFAVISERDVAELLVEGVGEEDAGVDVGEFVGRDGDAESEAGGAATVAHGLG
jgi:hypothetical protein